MPPRRSARLKKSRGEGTRDSCMTLMPYLHHDIWFDIFSWFSALCLHNIVTRVCKSWATIISHPDFVDTQLRRSTYGIFIWRQYDRSCRFLELVNNNVEITKMNLKNNCRGEPCSTYQGVILFRSYRSNHVNQVINPVTMQIAEIYHSQRINKKRNHCRDYSVIRDRRSGEYKLVLAFYNWSGTPRGHGWYVKKLGSGNKWDKIIGTKERFVLAGLSVGGFLCYANYLDRIIVILDVSDETVRKISCPGGYSPRTYLPMGNATALSSISFDSERIFIHVLTDLCAGNWSLYHILDTEFNQSLYHSITGPQYRGPKSPEFQRFIGWINNNEELVGRLCTFRNCCELGSCYESPCSKLEYRYRIRATGWDDCWTYFTYNLKTKHIRYLDSYISQYDIVRIHTNSLVSL